MTGLVPTRRVQVLLPLPLQGVLDYLAPAEMPLRRGDLVTVPLGGRRQQGVVWAMDPPPGAVPEDRLRPVAARLDLPPLPDNLTAFIDWVAAYTLSPPGAVLKMALSVPRAFDSPKQRRVYRLDRDGGADPDGLTPARRKVVEAALGDMALSLKDWAELAGVGDGVLRGMVKAGQMRPVTVTGDAPFPAPDLDLTPPVLSAEQAAAAGHFRTLVNKGGFQAALLEGVTGAGKTEVYFEAIHEALRDSAAQVLVLVPEIALTAQWLDRFRDRFGVEPALWHSELGPAQRRRAWWAVAHGQARVVVGARSALFLPFRTLALVVVDEEHSPTYKQEDGVMYHGRDMAVVRAHQAGCPVLLASATPSLETLVNAQTGKYDWLYLGERHGAAELPDMAAVDMRAHAPRGGEWLSDPLRAALEQTLARGEQALLYLNRRGYAPLTLCRACGHRLECPHCSAWLVEHRKKSAEGRRLHCHHCGFRRPRPDACPECAAADSLVPCGPGVERVAEEVRRLFPDARLAVMASDELAGPGEIREMVESIARHDVDFIIGTQIVTKGYHFPDLTLVGVVDADLGLAGGDPRAAERTWQQLEQVAGRAGRAEKPGTVLFQTYMPDHPVIRALISGDRDSFLEREAEEREQQQMPPFGRLAAVILSGPDYAAVVRAARRLAAAAPRLPGVVILGPAPAPLSFLRGRHRYRLLVKAEKAVNIQKILRNWLFSRRPEGGVRLQIDIDPISFF